jgi:hypothetical protein
MIIDGSDRQLAVSTAIQMQQPGVQQISAPKSSQQLDARNGSKTDTVQPLGGDTVSIKVELPLNTFDTLKKIGNTTDILNALATNLRQTNEGLTFANIITEKMKASLDRVIKDYPPYPIEDKGRMEQLMSYSSLRNQLQSLMIPAPPPPLYEKIKHLWEGLTSGVGSTVQTPSLPHEALTTHVKSASKQLDVISNQISLVQEAMANMVMKA